MLVISVIVLLFAAITFPAICIYALVSGLMQRRRMERMGRLDDGEEPLYKKWFDHYD